MKEFDYNTRYFDMLTKGWNERSFPLIAPLVRRMLERSAPQQILDYGCGSGTYASILSERGAEVEGCDVSAHVREACQQRYARFRHLSGSAELPAASYDLIFSTEVLEHIKDHNQTLRDFHQALRPGGRVLLTTTTFAPSVFTMLYATKARHAGFGERLRGLGEWLLGFLSVARADQFVVKWCFEYLGGHYHGFKRGALLRDFRRTGFEVLESGVFYALQPMQVAFLYSHTLRQLATRGDWPLGKRCAMVPFYCVAHLLNAVLKRLGLFANNVFIVARKS